MRNKFYLALLAAGALIALAVAGDASAFVMDGGSGSCLPPVLVDAWGNVYCGG